MAATTLTTVEQLTLGSYHSAASDGGVGTDDIHNIEIDNSFIAILKLDRRSESFNELPRVGTGDGI